MPTEGIPVSLGRGGCQVYSVGCNNSNCPISGVPPKDYVEKEFKAVYLK